jgi:hypothetical protein
MDGPPQVGVGISIPRKMYIKKIEFEQFLILQSGYSASQQLRKCIQDNRSLADTKTLK